MKFKFTADSRSNNGVLNPQKSLASCSYELYSGGNFRIRPSLPEDMTP